MAQASEKASSQVTPRPIRWRFDATNAALQTVIAERSGGVLQVDGTQGCALYGPYLEMPAGHCTATIRLAGQAAGRVTVDIASGYGTTTHAVREFDLAAAADGSLTLAAELAAQVEALEVRVHCQSGAVLAIAALEIDLLASTVHPPIAADRQTGWETRKTLADKIESGFIDRYLSGPVVLELGYRGYTGGTVPIVPQAIGLDLGYPGYDGTRLPFADGSVDAIYSSHCFEHVDDYVAVLRDWYRVLRTGGYIIVAVPHQHLFERRLRLPSRANLDHKRYYTSDSLLREIGEALPINGYRIRSLVENDKHFNYHDLASHHGRESYEIEAVVEKIASPGWQLEDDSIRPYSPLEFATTGHRPDNWAIDIDFSQEDGWAIWGPGLPLQFGDYEAEFGFEAIGLDDAPLASTVTMEVARQHHEGYVPLATVALTGEHGASALRSGSLRLRFSHRDHFRTLLLYRIGVSGRPWHGKLRFRGVVVRYAPPGD